MKSKNVTIEDFRQTTEHILPIVNWENYHNLIVTYLV